MTEIEQMTREVFEWLHPEGCWHKWKDLQTMECMYCGHELLFTRNPEYVSLAGRVLLLKEMMEREDCERFLSLVTNELGGNPSQFLRVFIEIYIAGDTGKLLDAVYEWAVKEEK